MAVRIYSLAKDLGIDSKELVDLCARIGIQGKGSALASLENDEIAKIKNHLAEKAAPSAEVAKESPKSQREPAKDAPIRDLGRPVTAKREIGAIRRPAALVDESSDEGLEVSVGLSTDAPAGEPQKLAAEPPMAQVEENSAVDFGADTKSPELSEEDNAVVKSPGLRVGRAPIAAQDEGSIGALSPEVQDDSVLVVATGDMPAAAPVAAKTRDSRVSEPSRDFTSMNVPGKVRVIGRTKPIDGAKPVGTGDAVKGVRKPREPVINLAKIPKSVAPSPAARAQEPMTLKPLVKLTPEVLKGVQQQQQQKQPGVQDKAGVGAAAKSGTGTGRATAPSQTQHAGLTEFKQAAENKLNQKSRKPTADVEEPARKKGLASLEASRAERSKLRVPNRIQTTRDLARVEEEEDRRLGGHRHRKKQQLDTGRKEKVELALPCTVRSFSEAAGVPAARVLRSLMMMGAMTNINATLNQEQAEMLAVDLGVDLEFKQAETLETSVIAKLDDFVDIPEDLVPRPPIVTFLGHVDHGKTSLLDYLIGTKIVTGEAGGITQHIRAYQVKKDGRAVSFVDTPGHEAFTEMRARGANVTDIAILVVAADDGIMPQTEEAISHAKAAGVPIVVAANKCDLPGADINRVMTQMTQHGLTPSAWGGDVEVVPTSAITGEGMDALLETVLTVAELNDYRANPKRAAMGVCLESEQSADRGVIAKVMVQTGTLRVGDIVVCGTTFGRVKAIHDTLKSTKQMTEAGPSMPVNITGLDHPPEAGEKFYVIDEIGQARQLASRREQDSRATSLSGSSPKVSFETFQELLQSGKLGAKEDRVILNLIIRADVRGSLEAIEKELSKLDHPEVDIRILQRSVGGISVADVTLASASQGVIVGFNVIPDESARILADSKNVEIRRYDIIYKLAQDIRALVEGRLKPEEKVVELGRAFVKAVFTVSRVGTIAGCFVAQGTIERGCRIRVHREGRKIGDYQLDTLRRVKDDVKEVNRGMECGIKLAGFNDVKVDDVLEAYKIEQVARTLESSKS
ncbi:MAG: translation initiation factor IF-2 [Planctomycetota bacterium]|nr:translation initiation factor IF-2 [Planctomycetota bacterium]